MQFIMFVCTDPGAPPPPADAPVDSVDTWVQRYDDGGQRTTGSALAPAAATKTVKVRDGGTVITDGPFAEAAEQIAGFDLLECADLDEACRIAARHPMAASGQIEVRALIDI
ncbi:MAG: YciI family protein [Mycobacteriales bacterium]|nr:MAG: hypothetical protein DLM56_12625 [Pseudonocardiales bacterium]